MNSLNIALVVEYDGSNYYGFQKQLNFVTIQNVLESVITKVANHDIVTVGSGRTDTGVHALFQIVNFTSYANRSLDNWLNGINSLLPKDIVVKEVKYVSDSFNARFSAFKRTYHYYLYVSKVRPSILNRKVGYYNGELNLELISEALDVIKGENDFACFKAENCQSKSSIRHMYEAGLSIKEFHSHKLLRFEFTANSFLYHMIRNIVSTLIYLGSNKMNLTEFKKLILSRNRKLTPFTFMPDGLYLVNVVYKNINFTSLNLDWIY